ncbi:MAG: hypothetical protein QG635_1394 [Bacteroidota bacterium]|nr:hypothetical protein [Bacteroidota bacterium]
MKKSLLILVLMILGVSLTFAQTPVSKGKKAVTEPSATSVKKADTKASVPKGAKAIKGEVVNLYSAINNAKAPGLKKDEAVGMAKRGEILALKAGGKLYLILYSDGRNASELLAEKAGAQVTVTGKLISKSGFNVILKSTIE